MKNETLTSNLSDSEPFTAQSLLGACLFVAGVFACANLIGCGTPFESHKKDMSNEDAVIATIELSVLKQTTVTDSQLKDLSVWRFYGLNFKSNSSPSELAISTDNRVQSKFTTGSCAYQVLSRTKTFDGANGVKIVKVIPLSTEIISAISSVEGVCTRAFSTSEIETLAYGDIFQLDTNIVTLTVKANDGKSGRASLYTRFIPSEHDSQQNCENPHSKCLQ